MMTTLTEQDVRDAFFARQTDRVAHTEECSAESIIREVEDPQTIAEDLESYRRGKQLLEDYIVLVSERSVVGGAFDDETKTRVVSPIVQTTSGHIATSVAYRAIALAQR